MAEGVRQPPPHDERPIGDNGLPIRGRELVRRDKRAAEKPDPATIGLAPEHLRSGLLAIPEGVKWTILGKATWWCNMIKGQNLTQPPARYVYIRMGEPRSTWALDRKLRFLGFCSFTRGELLEWIHFGRWAADAFQFDIDHGGFGSMLERAKMIGDESLIGRALQLRDAIAMALDADVMEKAVNMAAERGDFRGLVAGAQALNTELSILGGVPRDESSGPQQHLHAHFEGAPPSTRDGQTAAFGRIINGLDRLAADKRAKAVTVVKSKSNGHAEEPDEE